MYRTRNFYKSTLLALISILAFILAFWLLALVFWPLVFAILVLTNLTAFGWIWILTMNRRRRGLIK